MIIDSRQEINNYELMEYEKKLGLILDQKVDMITPRLMISSLICGYVWRLKKYDVIYGDPYVPDI